MHVPCPVIDFSAVNRVNGKSTRLRRIIDKPGNVVAYETCRRHRFPSHTARRFAEGAVGIRAPPCTA